MSPSFAHEKYLARLHLKVFKKTSLVCPLARRAKQQESSLKGTANKLNVRQRVEVLVIFVLSALPFTDGRFSLEEANLRESRSIF
jgi:hypothetical protein